MYGFAQICCVSNCALQFNLVKAITSPTKDLCLAGSTYACQNAVSTSTTSNQVCLRPCYSLLLTSTTGRQHGCHSHLHCFGHWRLATEVHQRNQLPWSAWYA